MAALKLALEGCADFIFLLFLFNFFSRVQCANVHKNLTPGQPRLIDRTIFKIMSMIYHQVLKRRTEVSEAELLDTILALRAHRHAQLSSARRNYLASRTVKELVELMIERWEEGLQLARLKLSFAFVWVTIKVELEIKIIINFVGN